MLDCESTFADFNRSKDLPDVILILRFSPELRVQNRLDTFIGRR